MANNQILIKRSAVPGKKPTTSNLALGELAINTNDGKIYTRREFTVESELIEEVVEFVGKVPVGNAVYVSVNGQDYNEGQSWDTAFSSMERALEAAWERNAVDPTCLTLIDVGPGIYYTNGHLDMPDNCMIRSVHRTAIFKPNPGYEQRNVFRMGSGCFIEGLLFENFQIDDNDNPTEGFAFSFRPGAVIFRAPYAHKCAVRSNPTWGYIAPPLDAKNGNPLVPRGAGVVLADGAVCSPYSIYPNIMTWGATPVTQNGIGYCAKNGALINAVNAVSIWAHKHFYALDGGQIILSSCSTQFGDYTLVAKGSRNLVSPQTVNTTNYIIPLSVSDVVVINPQRCNTALSIQDVASVFIDLNKTTIIDNMWTALVDGGYTAGWTSADETLTRRDANTYISAIVKVLQHASESYMLDFARGLFFSDGTKVFSSGKEAAVLFSFENMRDQILALGVFYINADTIRIVNALVSALETTITSPVTFTGSVLTNSNAAAAIQSSKATIINDMLVALVREGYTETWSPAAEAFTVRDAGTLLDAMTNTLIHGDEKYMLNFARSLFYSGNPVFTSDKLDAFKYSYYVMRDSVKELTYVSGDTEKFVEAMFTALSFTVRYPNYDTTTLVADPASAAVISASKQAIIDDLWIALSAGGYTSGWTETDEVFTRRDAGTFLQSLIWVVQTANEKPMLDFAKGLYDTKGVTIIDSNKISAFLFAYNHMRDYISFLPGISPASQIIINALVTALNTTTTSPVFRSEPSTITAIGHTFTGVLAGVALTKIPPVKNTLSIQDSILELDQGLVIASGQDDQGNAIFVGGMRIDKDTGELSGPPFEQAVNRIATRTAISRSF